MRGDQDVMRFAASELIRTVLSLESRLARARPSYRRRMPHPIRLTEKSVDWRVMSMRRRRRSFTTTHVPLAKHPAGAVGTRHQRAPQDDGGTRSAYGLIAAAASAASERVCVLVALLASGSAFASQLLSGAL
jgi:hypothetical protein